MLAPHLVVGRSELTGRSLQFQRYQVLYVYPDTNYLQPAQRLLRNSPPSSCLFRPFQLVADAPDPQIMLYKDGALVEQYNEDRSYESLSGYIEDQAIPYARGEAIPAGTEAGSSSGSAEDAELDAGQMAALQLLKPATKRPNPEGKVIEADAAKFEEVKKAGPAFVEFFAPWCGQ